MTKEEVLEIFRKAGAILEGHFILTSGRHSAIYMQKAKVFMHASYTEALCKALAKKLEKNLKTKIDYLVGPAIGGLIPSYEVSRHMNVPSIWVERENGEFCLRRFEIEKGAKVLIIEDIVTTGLSIRETILAMKKVGADIVGAGALIDRSDGNADVGVPLIPLCSYKVDSYAFHEVPEELAKIPAVKPGSRTI